MSDDRQAITLDATFCSGVVQHMNEDHEDSCLMLVQAFTSKASATNAIMTGMDARGLMFDVVLDNGENTSARVTFDRPITDVRQVRGYIVSLAKKAREMLNA